MSEQFAIIEGVVGSDAQGVSIHRHKSREGQDRYLATIGLRDGSKLIWQEIEMTGEQARQFQNVIANGNVVKVSGLLRKRLGLPVYRVELDCVQLIRAAQPTALRRAA